MMLLLLAWQRVTTGRRELRRVGVNRRRGETVLLECQEFPVGATPGGILSGTRHEGHRYGLVLVVVLVIAINEVSLGIVQILLYTCTGNKITFFTELVYC